MSHREVKGAYEGPKGGQWAGKVIFDGETVLVEAIQLGRRLRPVSDAGVEAVMASIDQLKLMKDPIHVRRLKGRRKCLVLIAGGHRLEAARRIGWTRIPARIWECTDDWASMMEIDDNIAGSGLKPVDEAVFLAARKTLYDRLHPETQQGAAGAAVRWGDATADSAVASFAASSAEKFGIKVDDVYRLVRVGHALKGGEVDLLRGAPRPVKLDGLLQIARIGDDDERAAVCEMLNEGTATSAAKARKAYAVAKRGGEAPVDDGERAAQALAAAWRRASATVRRRFVMEHRDVIGHFLHNAGLDEK